jgi:hypothetical protein
MDSYFKTISGLFTLYGILLVAFVLEWFALSIIKKKRYKNQDRNNTKYSPCDFARAIKLENHKICKSSCQYVNNQQEYCSPRNIHKRIISKLKSLMQPNANRTQKRVTRSLLRYKQDGRCIILGCSKERQLHLHRCLPGYLGGEYTEDNCVLVCAQHHPQLEQYRSKQEVLQHIGKGYKNSIPI